MIRWRNQASSFINESHSIPYFAWLQEIYYHVLIFLDIYLESQENCLLSTPPLAPLYFAQAAIISQLDYCRCLLNCFYAPELILILPVCFWICSSVHLQVQHPEWFPLNINLSIPLLCFKAPELNLSPHYKWNLFPISLWQVLLLLSHLLTHLKPHQPFCCPKTCINIFTSRYLQGVI